MRNGHASFCPGYSRLLAWGVCAALSVQAAAAAEAPQDRLLYSEADIAAYETRMSGAGPFYETGDAGHGGSHAPNDGQRAEQHAADFLDDPEASYWTQPDLPLSAGDPWPGGIELVRPMHAAWIYMTRPDHPHRDELREQVRALLLDHAADPTLDYGDAENYPVDFAGWAAGPIFAKAQLFTGRIKARDMLGRDAFDEAENAQLDRWFYDYANWIAHWLHQEVYSNHIPGRLDRDYSTINWPENAERRSYDGGPRIGSAGMAYTNRHAATAATMSLAANYLKHHGYEAPTSGGPDYGLYSVDELVDHSRLFVEETIRFSVWAEGIQGDFERGDADHHDAPPQQGWLYSINVLANLLEIAEYHAKRGDMSVWEYGTTEGHDGSAGQPVAGDFDEKNLHFYAWAMARYVNDGWERTNRGEPLVLDRFYHAVIPAATAHRFVPDDDLLEAAWKADGKGMPPYPEHPQSQGPWHAHYGEGAKMIGVIEHGGMPALTPE